MLEDAIRILKEKTQTLDIRLDAILYIVDRFEQDCLPIFEDILKDESEHSDIRGAVALALGKIGGEPVMKILLQQVEIQNVPVKNYVLEALGKLGRAEVAPALINALKDKNNLTFASAADALGFLGKPVVPHLIQLLFEGADDARCVAAWKLGELRYTEAIPSLIQVLREDKNIEVLALAIWALGEIGEGSPEVIEVLSWGTQQIEPEIKLRAQLALKKIARHQN